MPARIPGARALWYPLSKEKRRGDGKPSQCRSIEFLRNSNKGKGWESPCVGSVRCGLAPFDPADSSVNATSG